MQSTAGWGWNAGPAATKSQRPWATYALLYAVVAVMSVQVFLATQSDRLAAFVKTYGLTSTEVVWSNPASYLPLMTFNFLHSDARHFAANAIVMLFACAAVEKHAGRRATLIIWVAGGVVSGLAHLVIFPDSTRSLIGASGAISAMLGVAFVLGWRWALPVKLWAGRRQLFAIPLPAVMTIWLLFQVNSVARLAISGTGTGGVATWVHLAGFAFGMLCAGVLLLSRGASTQPAAHPVTAGD